MQHILGKVEGQAGWGCKQPDLVEDAPTHCTGLEQMTLYGSFQPKPFYSSINKDHKKLENFFHFSTTSTLCTNSYP